MDWTLRILLLSCLFVGISCWDSDDLEVFDVVEEVGENFYTLLDIPETASSGEIKKAFRRLSLVLHPDKNSSPDAEVKFRQLVSVYEILRDAKKRAIYADVLENGLPDWKQAVYYFRRVRKMGLAEMSAILFVIITIGQYLVAWAAYFEKRYAIQEFVNTKKKSLERKQKKGKIEVGTAEMLPEMLVSSIPKPTVACTLPVQICKLVWFIFIELPPLTFYWIKNYIKTRNEKVEPESESSSEEEVVVVRERGPRRRKGGFQAPEVKGGGGDHANSAAKREATAQAQQQQQQAPPPPVLRGGLWTDDDFEDLIKLMKKFPPGTQDRWDKIGESMKRAPSEVAHMAHKIKDEGFNPFKQTEEAATAPSPEVKKVKTRDGGWSQAQQKALETAIAKYFKGVPGNLLSSPMDKWDMIANAVPNKTKEECISRYKYLRDSLKKKKESPQPPSTTVQEPELCESQLPAAPPTQVEVS